MKNTNVILYSAGAYGNFVNWCCSYFSGLIDDISVPFTDTGSVHNKFPGQMLLISPREFKNFMITGAHSPFIQLHEASISSQDFLDISSGNFLNVLIKNLEILTNNFNKIIYIFPTSDSISWYTNNAYTKIKPMEDLPKFGIKNPQEYAAREFNENLITIWLKNGMGRLRSELEFDQSCQTSLDCYGVESVTELDTWQFREFCSHYYYDKIHNQLLTPTNIDELRLRFKNVRFVKLDDFRDDFNECLLGILDHFDICGNTEQLSEIYKQWVECQYYINNDLVINNAVCFLINAIDRDWSNQNLTFFDEILIQRKLLDNGISIKCFGLNKFPANTRELLPLLMRKSQ
jgi:hypothetical protein